MSRRAKNSNRGPAPSSDERAAAIQDHEHGRGPCERCQALEARIAELEAACAERGGEDQTSTTSPSKSVPSVEFRALRLLPFGWGEGWQLRPAPAQRHWMDELPHAYKCLPLVVANQWGWQILCPTEVVVTWDGNPGQGGLRVEVAPQFEPAIKSQFGGGIVTSRLPGSFARPPGWDLYLKGPTNRWKPNCVPLEGVIETWWLNYTFTLNWKLVQPGTVVFRQGESLGQLVPVPHLTFEDATATEAPIGLFELKAAESSCSGRKNVAIAVQMDKFTTCTARPRESPTIFIA